MYRELYEPINSVFSKMPIEFKFYFLADYLSRSNLFLSYISQKSSFKRNHISNVSFKNKSFKQTSREFIIQFFYQ